MRNGRWWMVAVLILGLLAAGCGGQPRARAIAVALPVQEGTPLPPPVVAADFDSCAETNNLGGQMGAAFEAPDHLTASYQQEADRGCVVRIEYNIAGQAAYRMSLRGADLMAYRRLLFDARAEPEPGIPRQIKLEVKRRGEAGAQYVAGIGAEWQTLSVELADFREADSGAPPSSWLGMEELLFTFEAATSGRQGVIYLDNVVFVADAASEPTVEPEAPTPTPTNTVTPTVTPAPSLPGPGLPCAAQPVAGLEVIPGAELRIPRTGHTATRLADGRILLMGGSRAVDDRTADEDIFDPATGQTSQAAPLNRPRQAHSATLLGDGRVLVIGGYAQPWGWLDDAEVYDPVQDRWTVVPPLHSHGMNHTATVMVDGRVLVAGGCIGSGTFTARAEIFDPQSNAWTEAQPLPGERTSHTAQLLADGRVLVIGGQTDATGLVGGDALLYDPESGSWTPTAPMVNPRLAAPSARLGDGRVLVAGGMTLAEMPTNTFSALAEIYDPAANAWTAAADLSQPRFGFSLALLPSGRAVAVGGSRDWDNIWTPDSFVREIEVYDPEANEWRTVAELPQPRVWAAAVLLPDGHVWVSGGRTDTIYYADSWWLSEGKAGVCALAIPVDDFSPQPAQGDRVYFYNRLDGDHGAANSSRLTWGQGQVTTAMAAEATWGGGWESLNHPMREGLPIDFSAILPAQILPPYQGRITGVTARVLAGTPGTTFRLELKEKEEQRWTGEVILEGGHQVASFKLPPLGKANELLWVLDHAKGGDFVILDSIALTATTQITDTATAAFAWGYGQLLNNWNPATGLVRDKARNASGEFDAVQATGALAAATAMAEQMGLVSRDDAIEIVDKVGAALLGLPRFHGLWPHFVQVGADVAIAIAPGTEWSSVDTTIAAVGLLLAQEALGLDTAGAEQALRDIDWADLILPSGAISMGYSHEGERFSWGWDTFGGESWLVALAYASATGQVATIPNPAPPTANGAGFIDELAWLLVPPPEGPDAWGADWAHYRSEAADKQVRYYQDHYPDSCFDRLGQFGLSSAEAPAPWLLPAGTSAYQAFGVGGRAPDPNDGTALLGAPVVVPHYAAMIASLRPEEATRMWARVIAQGYFTPLTNVESLMFRPGATCEPAGVEWNQMKGSWNLSLQALGWGRFLAERVGQVPILWRAARTNGFVQEGYRLLAPGGSE